LGPGVWLSSVTAAVLGVALIAGSASACPAMTRCLAMVDRHLDRHVVGPAVRPAIRDAVRPAVVAHRATAAVILALPASAHSRVQRDDAFSLRERPTPGSGSDSATMWTKVRKQVDTHTPGFEQENRFTVKLSPLVIRAPSSTVPGVGFRGRF
jgi:hypothetical protein